MSPLALDARPSPTAPRSRVVNGPMAPVAAFTSAWRTTPRTRRGEVVSCAPRVEPGVVHQPGVGAVGRDGDGREVGPVRAVVGVGRRGVGARRRRSSVTTKARSLLVPARSSDQVMTIWSLAPAPDGDAVGDVDARERVGPGPGDAVDGEPALGGVELADAGERLHDRPRALEVGAAVERAGLEEHALAGRGCRCRSTRRTPRPRCPCGWRSPGGRRSGCCWWRPRAGGCARCRRRRTRPRTAPARRRRWPRKPTLQT